MSSATLRDSYHHVLISGSPVVAAGSSGAVYVHWADATVEG